MRTEYATCDRENCLEIKRRALVIMVNVGEKNRGQDSYLTWMADLC